jgi:hypothetical protein
MSDEQELGEVTSSKQEIKELKNETVQNFGELSLQSHQRSNGLKIHPRLHCSSASSHS